MTPEQTGSMTTDQLIAAATKKLAAALDGQERLALLYSGGLESNLLLALARPWKERVTVFTAMTGEEFPHMLSFIQEALNGWDRKIIRTSVSEFFANVGLPANVMPIEHQPGLQEFFGAVREPRIVAWVECCIRNRNEPVWRAIKESGIVSAAIGQREKDWLGPRAAIAVEGFDVSAPFWANTRQEIRDMVAKLNVKIPAHYAEFDGSLDCACCPASLTPARRSFMRKYYPERLADAEAFQGIVSSAVANAMSGEATFHNHLA
jgi:3'-phosphoadenosine 5'-phosphosulfate sulfotransferase (PAPS reductase)/FAD synthetase